MTNKKDVDYEVKEVIKSLINLLEYHNVEDLKKQLKEYNNGLRGANLSDHVANFTLELRKLAK